uniref:Protein kinase domain-containing protein n=1 Tax=Oryza barthii TaxID=65489 RepID=A0A0D3HC19_9ORYZ
MEYMSSGDLDYHLHVKNSLDSLDIRLDIAIECADALRYLHSMCNPVLHGDVKPYNILLGDNFNAKISDFGISRPLSLEKTYTSNVIGSIGYMDPLYRWDGRLTPKSDVYSFGIVLLVLITKKRAASIAQAHAEGVFTVVYLGTLENDKKVAVRTHIKGIEHGGDRNGNELNLSELIHKNIIQLLGFCCDLDAVMKCSLVVEYVNCYEKENSGRIMFDNEITAEENMATLEAIGILAMKCLSDKIDERLKMREVAEQLVMLKMAWKQRKGNI